ncbi:hypothetical protein [Mesorhizobium sp. B4-1-4]|uniref:hypothetical protein n=1 Tax=Mesorhizobium sp. B4-1-4 TaxID=2589888 RepID=UPI0011299F39|nr:hypothetical protein [Mesorhizobium sp. B4-1-4]UCI31771.1 hypothetical protein FJW03_29125 [Mesorhizobium sp. B4-1-4]
MPNAPSNNFTETEIERLMADTLVERLRAIDKPEKSSAAKKEGPRSRKFRIAESTRLRATVKKAVRDVFQEVAPFRTLDPATARLLEPLSAVVAEKRVELSERNMELLVEAMLPANDPMSEVRSKIEADNARARVGFVESVPCLTSADLAGLAGHNARNKSATGSRWKAEKKVFSVQLRGRELFPAFQFRDGKPDPAVAQVLQALPPKMSQWQVAFWFVSSNPWLDGKVPSENLERMALVVEAARKLGEATTD